MSPIARRIFRTQLRLLLLARRVHRRLVEAGVSLVKIHDKFIDNVERGIEIATSHYSDDEKAVFDEVFAEEEQRLRFDLAKKIVHNRSSDTDVKLN
jgi:hypothetical protein